MGGKGAAPIFKARKRSTCSHCGFAIKPGQPCQAYFPLKGTFAHPRCVTAASEGESRSETRRKIMAGISEVRVAPGPIQPAPERKQVDGVPVKGDSNPF